MRMIQNLYPFTFLQIQNFSINSAHIEVNEETVRRYLAGKGKRGLTVLELLEKFNNEIAGLTPGEIVSLFHPILKKINPNKKAIYKKMHLFINDQMSYATRILILLSIFVSKRFFYSKFKKKLIRPRDYNQFIAMRKEKNKNCFRY